MSSELEQHRAEIAFDVETRIKETITLLRAGWVRLAEDLYRMVDLGLWADLGYQSFEEWLAGPEIDLERRWVFQLIANWRELVVKLGVEPARLESLEPSKLQEVLPALRRGKVQIESALADAETLSKADLRERYSLTNILGLNEGSTNGHQATEEFSPHYAADMETEYAVCHACGSRYRVT